VTEIFKKLNFKAQNPVLVLEAPKTFEAELDDMAAETSIHRTRNGRDTYAFAMGFAPMKADFERLASALKEATEADAVLWIAYPKKTSKRFSSDIDRDLCAQAAVAFCLKPVRQIALDDDWSALRYKRS